MTKPPTDGEPMGQADTPEAELISAIRDGDEETILRVRTENDWLKESVDILRLCVAEHDSRIPICEECEGAWQRVLPIDREITSIARIVPKTIEEARSIPAKLEELRAEVQRELTRARRGRSAAAEVMAIRTHWSRRTTTWTSSTTT